MQDSSIPPDPHPAGHIQNNLWAEVLDVCRRLKLSTQVVNLGSTQPQKLATRWTPAVGRSLAGLDEATLQAALDRALETSQPQTVAFEDVNVVCYPIAGSNDRAAGVVLLAGPVGNAGGAGDGFGDGGHLTTIASWLSAALGARPSSASQEATELHRLAALLQILEKAVALGSEREIVSALIEALAVWTDAEAWGYLGDLSGQFTLQVSLPGSDRSSVPATAGADIIPADDSFLPLSAAEAARAGFDGRTSISILRIRPRGASDWLIAVRGVPDSREQARIVLYGSVLAQALTALNAITSSRLTWGMLQHLWPVVHEGSLERAAENATKELSAVIGGSIGFSVMRDGTQPVLLIGHDAHQVFSKPLKTAAEFLSVLIPVSSRLKARIGISAPVDRPLTRRDETLVQCSRQVLGGWLSAVVGRLLPPSTRRSISQPFQEVVEQQAHDASENKSDISMIVVSIAAHASWTELTRAWVAEIRRQLRPRDRTGRLASGDIGILLPETSEDGAQIVATRLKRLMESDPEFGPLSGAYLDLAVEPVSSHSTESLVTQAEMRATLALQPPAGRMEDRIRPRPDINEGRL